MSSFVQAADLRFYRNPVIDGSDWYVRFEDTPEIVVRKFKTSTPESGSRRARKVMHESGVEAQGIKFLKTETNAFPPKWDMMLDSLIYSFKLVSYIPEPDDYEAVVDEPGDLWSHNIYGFTSSIKTRDLIDCVIGGDIDPLIARALLAQPIYKKDQESVRPEICKKLYAQHPWLRTVTKENWVKFSTAQPVRMDLQWRNT